MSESDQHNPRPLEGIRVLEMGQLVAGPFAGCTLAYFGAEVIKIEAPGSGDPLRNWRVLRNGTSLWWHSLGRNKKSVTLNLRIDEGRQIARRLALESDVLIENFRPGTLEKWGMAPADLRREKPDLVVARISGYGQTGPYASRPGFASVCEGIGGLRYINGFPGQPPVRPNLSLGDTLAGLHCVIGILLALVNRARTRQGQGIDVAIYESVFNMLESVVPEYDGAGIVREPSGSTITGIAPTNTYLCADGKYVIIGGNGDSIFRRLMAAAGRPDLADDPRFANNAGRVEHQDEIDDAISKWTGSLTSGDVLARLESAEVPCGPIYSVADMMSDPHFNARALFEETQVVGGPLKIPALMPKLDRTPGGTRWTGPALGAHSREVLCGLLGISDAEFRDLAARGIT
ncbi:MAG: CaiB/BaiF CoA-transferase family protein [Gammaproteobacteria bacterium]|nr:CaiB/BaiF CoA-transferase family protein [Gammaproteobacteria bacterium]